jgi:hypothetical protein
MLATLTSYPCAKSDDWLAPYSHLIKDHPFFRIYFCLLKLIILSVKFIYSKNVQKILLICVKASVFLATRKVTKSSFYNMIPRHEILIPHEKKAFERPTGKISHCNSFQCPVCSVSLLAGTVKYLLMLSPLCEYVMAHHCPRSSLFYLHYEHLAIKQEKHRETTHLHQTAVTSQLHDKERLHGTTGNHYRQLILLWKMYYPYLS